MSRLKSTGTSLAIATVAVLGTLVATSPAEAATAAQSADSSIIDGPLIDGPLIEGGLLSLFFGNYKNER